MSSFERRFPKNGVRQPRILYRVDDPRMKVLEDLRELGGFGNLNALFLEALVIGAAVLLSKARDQGFELSGETTPSLPPDEEFVFPVPPRVAVPPLGSVSPSPVVGATSVTAAPGVSDLEKDRDAKVSPVVEPTLSVPPLEMPRLGIPPRPSISAADAQFDRFGD